MTNHNNVEEGAELQMFDTIRDLIGQTLNNPEFKSAQPRNLIIPQTHVPSGFMGIDKQISGFAKGELTLIAARPGMGKTAFMLSLIHNLTVHSNYKIALFSLERDGLQFANRLLERETGLPVKKLIRDIAILDAEVDSQIQNLAQCEILIDAPKHLTIEHFKEKCEAFVNKYQTGLVIIDALELIIDGGNPEKLLSELKEAAAQFNVPVLVFATLSKLPDVSSKLKRPELSDLGLGFSQHADTVMFIYRPEYDMITQDEMGNSLKGRAEIIIAKHTSANTSTVALKYCEKFSSFTDLN